MILATMIAVSCQQKEDQSLDVHNPEMKRQKYPIDAEYYFKHGLSENQRQRIHAENQLLKPE